MMAKEKQNEATVPMFTKEQVLASSKWADSKDALAVLLSADKQYSADDVNKALETFMKGKVK